MANEEQPSRGGRPCTVCGHLRRFEAEDAILSGEALSSVSSAFNITRQSLRRHRAHHMAVALQLSGVSPYDVVLRLTETADRLHDLADQAEDRGLIADATRAVLAESKTLHLLLNLGVQGQTQVDYAGDAAGLEAAVAAVVRQVPGLGDQIAEQLDRADRSAYGDKLRAFADKCQAVSENNTQELTHNAVH